MPNPPLLPRSATARLAVAVTSVVTASAALAGLSVLRRRTHPRTHPRTPGPAEVFAIPADAAAPPSPLRQDTGFTPDDGRGTLVRYSVSLPADYYTAARRYPVVYALHGKTQDNVVFLDEALSLRWAMAAGVLDEAVIVTPDGYSTGRWENRETGPAEDDVIKHLIPHVEQRYRVEPGPEHRLLTGFSMGGHGAIRFGLKYPTMFAAVWSVDGAMAGSEHYLPLIEGRSSADFRIIASGGQLNGDRVERLVTDLGRHGVRIPFVRQNVRHEFVDFVAEDQRSGWPALKYLQYHLGRPL